MLAQQERAREIHVEGIAPVVQRQCVDGDPRRFRRCIGHHDIESAERIDGGRDAGLHRSGITDIACRGQGPPTRVAELGRNRPDGGRVDVQALHGRTLGSERAGNGSTDAMACSGDHRDLVFQALHGVRSRWSGRPRRPSGRVRSTAATGARS